VLPGGGEESVIIVTGAEIACVDGVHGKSKTVLVRQFAHGNGKKNQ
jgi:hypothetical protein